MYSTYDSFSLLLDLTFSPPLLPLFRCVGSFLRAHMRVRKGGGRKIQ